MEGICVSWPLDLPTNTFEVFSREKAGNENHLTRALLVLLRLSPLAQEVWLRKLGLGASGITGMGDPLFVSDRHPECARSG